MLRVPPPATRTTSDKGWRCPCSVCEISRLSLNVFLAYDKERRNPPGPVPATDPTPPPFKIQICSECHGEVARGKAHHCGAASRHRNMAELAADCSPGSKQVLARSALRSLAAEFNVAPGGNLALGGLSGPRLNIVIGTSRRVSPTPLFSHQAMTRVQTALGLSDNRTLMLAKAIRSQFGRRSVETYLTKAIVERNCQLENLFELVTLNIPDKSGKEMQAPGVFCSDVPLLIAKLIQDREIDPSAMDVHVGIDNGQGSLKVFSV